MYWQVYKQAVEINVTCCHPGYHYVSENKTCSFTLHYPHILRAEASNRYIYLNVSGTIQIRNIYLVNNGQLPLCMYTMYTLVKKGILLVYTGG